MTTTDLTQPKSSSAPATRTDEELQQFTRTVLAQIGRPAAAFDLGVDQIVYGETADGRMFTWFTTARHNTRYRLVKVTVILDWNDTYIVRGGYMDRKAFDFETVAEFDGVYCDALTETAIRAAEQARTEKRTKR